MAEGGVASGLARRERLAERRKALGLTQERLAELLDVGRTTVARWERGETRPLPWLRPKLARELRVSTDRLEELLAADDGQAGPDNRAGSVPRLLPATVADFIGRAAELATLTGILDRAATGTPGTVVISAIGGTPGVGKTALALCWAHQVAARFPDGQLYVNLRGFDPSGSPAAPAEAIRGFLDALGVPAVRVPPMPEAQAGLYRSLLADRRMLIVLDNARDEQQVRPLLPASRGCLVLVTSRNQLSGLAVVDGARLISLDVLTHAEAVQMLTVRLGAARAGAERGAVDEIARRCGCLPLALAVTAARAATRPRFPLTALAAELADAADRLDVLDAGDTAASVPTVFSWSYRQLTDAAARMFRLLGIHPGPDITAAAAASLAATSETEARRLLDELARAHMITEHAPGRHALHDLLRAYAASQAATEDRQSREAAARRLLDHYLHTGYTAGLLISRSRGPIALASPAPGVAPGRPADYKQALAWFEAEHQVLLAAISLADTTGFDVHSWQIPWTMGEFLNKRGHWHEWAAIQRTAAAAAERLGDLAGQAISLRLLAQACARLGEYEQAMAGYATSLRLYQQLGDRVGEAKVYRLLAAAADTQGRYDDALVHAKHSLDLFQAVGHSLGLSGMLNIAWYHARQGNHQEARVLCQQALALSAELGQRNVESYAWDRLGYAEHHLGNFAEAALSYERALLLARDLGDVPHEADVLTLLGDAHHASGELSEARKAWQQALAILQDLQHPSADPVRAKLASTDTD